MAPWSMVDKHRGGRLGSHDAPNDVDQANGFFDAALNAACQEHLCRVNRMLETHESSGWQQTSPPRRAHLGPSFFLLVLVSTHDGVADRQSPAIII